MPRKATTAKAKSNGRAKSVTTRSNANGKPAKKRQATAGWLVPDVPVPTSGKKGRQTYELVIAPPKISRSRDLVRWLERDCVRWLAAISYLAEAKADHDVIEKLAFDLRILVEHAATCLRTGKMPMVDAAAGLHDPLPFLAAARQLVTGIEECSGQEESTERLLATVERMVRPLQAKAEAQRAEDFKAWVPPHKQREAEEEEKVIRARFLDAKLKRLREKQTALLDQLSEMVAPELDREIEALEKERSEQLHEALADFHTALGSPAERKRERGIQAEVSRRLAGEGLAAAAPA